MELVTTIPKEVMALIREKKVIEAGFSAGPACAAGKVQAFPESLDLEEGVGWLEKYRHVIKAAHLLLDDKTVLWFDRHGFNKYDQTRAVNPPRPGAEITTSD